MKVNCCIPSRGRHKLVGDCVRQLLATAKLEDTRIVVGLDDDEAVAADTQFPGDGERAIYSIEPREDSLGAKYNRCAVASPADIYVLWSDDQTITSPGWDQVLVETAKQFTDGIGVLYFGKVPGILQPGMAVTQGFIDQVGYFAPPYFPYWWHDTTIDEIGRLSGRIVNCDITVKMLADLKGASRGVRDIAWWANFFDATRPERIAAADRIIDSGNDQPYRRTQLRQQRAGMIRLLRERESGNRDAVTARDREKYFAFDAPADERYARVKATAQRMLEVSSRVAA